MDMLSGIPPALRQLAVRVAKQALRRLDPGAFTERRQPQPPPVFPGGTLPTWIQMGSPVTQDNINPASFVPLSAQIFSNRESDMLQYLKNKKLAVAILFAGGPASAANFVLAAFAQECLRNGIEVIGIRSGFEHLGTLDPSQLKEGEHYVRINEQIIEEALSAPWQVLTTSRGGLGIEIESSKDLQDAHKKETAGRIITSLEHLKVGALVTAGGNGTLTAANFLEHIVQERQGIIKGVFAVPKTIDNDVPGIDYTYGFWTTAEKAAEQLYSLYCDARSTDSYFLPQLMGRRASWLNFAASLGGRTSFSIGSEDYIKKESISPEEIAKDLLKIMLWREKKRGNRYGVFSLSEGLTDKLPPEIKAQMQKDRFGKLSLSGSGMNELVSNELGRLYRETTGRKINIKPVEIGYTVRVASPNLFDRTLAQQLGLAAFALLAGGFTGHMATIGEGGSPMGLPLSAIIDPITLAVVDRPIASPFYSLLRHAQNLDPSLLQTLNFPQFSMFGQT
ncbi:MAG: 6-phosphofructokinase [Candidatus Saganbacteria bacterium]|nr:6-phosphofructokinase [Candidatus Saganbacteria bacterium]